MVTTGFFLLLIAVVAFLYASVGHGGASGYLALMVIFGMSPLMMKTSALTLNIFVSAISFYQFYRQGFFKPQILLPFIITSIPLSFMGAMMQVDAHVYKVILAICLLVAIARLLGVFGKTEKEEVRPVRVTLALFIGAIIGFFSGMIGIGGGILLSPILLLFNWARMKETAAVSAAFIFLNSVAGIFGSAASLAVTEASQMAAPVAMAVVGGTLGGYFGSNRFNNVSLKYILAVVLLFACFKLVVT